MPRELGVDKKLLQTVSGINENYIHDWVFCFRLESTDVFISVAHILDVKASVLMLENE